MLKSCEIPNLKADKKFDHKSLFFLLFLHMLQSTVMMPIPLHPLQHLQPVQPHSNHPQLLKASYILPTSLTFFSSTAPVIAQPLYPALSLFSPLFVQYLYGKSLFCSASTWAGTDNPLAFPAFPSSTSPLFLSFLHSKVLFPPSLWGRGNAKRFEDRFYLSQIRADATWVATCL